MVETESFLHVLGQSTSTVEVALSSCCLFPEDVVLSAGRSGA